MVTTRPARRPATRPLAALALLMLLLAALILGRAPFWLGGIYIVAGPISGLLYVVDKRAAQAGAWRISEATLHLVDFCCGIIGGLLAQQMLRHKTAKPGYRLTTWIIVAIHGAVLAAIAVGLINASLLAGLAAAFRN
jgi:uncharacterized membrane protein YsdA (DUF1294 family)